VPFILTLKMEAVELSKRLKYDSNSYFFPEDGSPICLRNKGTVFCLNPCARHLWATCWTTCCQWRRPLSTVAWTVGNASNALFRYLLANYWTICSGFFFIAGSIGKLHQSPVIIRRKEIYTVHYLTCVVPSTFFQIAANANIASCTL
jgi:hypothetical protein